MNEVIVANLEHNATISEIKDRARNIRVNIIKMLTEAKSGHPAGALGLADIYSALFFRVLRYDRENPKNPDRDILVISNGHTVPVFYASLAEIGVIPESELMTLRKFGSRLQGHPERHSMPWIETTSGPLGSGLSQAAGMAHSLKNIDGDENRRIYCVIGDGELNEGNNWEAMMFAAKNKLNNLIAIIDRNYIQIEGNTEEVMPLEPLDKKFESFGWHVIKINGNDVIEFIDACEKAQMENNRPIAILANIVPGKGVSFMENNHLWHGKVPSLEETKEALLQLETEKREIIVNENDEIIDHKYWYDRDGNDISRGSSLWVVMPDNDGYKVLIAQRKWSKKYNPGEWDVSASGTNEENESYEDNIYKEAAEEIGLINTKFIQMYDKPIFHKKSHVKGFVMYYIAIGNWKLSDFTPQESEIEALDIVPIDDLLRDSLENPSKYTPNFHDMITELKNYLEKME